MFVIFVSGGPAKSQPRHAVAIDSGDAPWGNRASILDGAKKFAASGAKLVHLEFPRTEIQMYGRTIIVYTTYLYEIEKDGQKSKRAGGELRCSLCAMGNWSTLVGISTLASDARFENSGVMTNTVGATPLLLTESEQPKGDSQ